jgi:hypothetical protein
MTGLDPGRRFNAIHERHVDIHDYDDRLQHRYSIYRVSPVACLTDHCYVAIALQDAS